MPPRPSLTSSFSIADSGNEVICPLPNQDGSSCRKRCIGDKRYRSMQEHIRRAHPDYYIPKLPATEESFLLMTSNVNPARRSADHPPSSAAPKFDRRSHHRDGSSHPGTSRHADEYIAGGGSSMLGTAGAAAALAELHGVKSDRESDLDPDDPSDTDGRRVPRASIELPPLHIPRSANDLHSSLQGRPKREFLPSLLADSPPGRSSTLPPLHRSLGPNRPRRQSVTKRSRESHHKRKNSRGSAADWLLRIQNDDLRPGGTDRKALSAEPSADFGKRWEDLIDAADQAASAAGDLDEDRTPVPRSPVSIHRSSLPPFQHQQHMQPGSYQASPLQQALTPPPNHQDGTDPFPSVESGESGENFHIESHGLSDSSPSYTSPSVQIYCAGCQGISHLRNSYACTECICGLCSACVEVLVAEQGARRKCPRCATIGGRFKPFQLDVR